MKKVVYFIPAIIMMGIVFYSSSQEYQEQDIRPLLKQYVDLSFLTPLFENIRISYHNNIVSVETHGIEGFIEFFLRKGAHVTVFLLICLFLYYGITKSFAQMSDFSKMCFAFFVTVLYALFDEWHQSMTPNRTRYIGDVWLDSLGASLAILFIWIVLHFRTKKTQ